MPAILTVITEDDLLDFANGEADAETRMAVKAAKATDRRVQHMLVGIAKVDRALDSLGGPTKAGR